MRRACRLQLLALSLAAATSSAQTVLRLPGKTVEVLGLHRWTIAMLVDSLSRLDFPLTGVRSAAGGVLRPHRKR